ncbi:hypothetical protein HYPSUDRAFT_131237 [Hypholoma sublateritium FD-334 SS-4]|uniref:Uncharacterized protein n=1 Tax=Hypholoma sublateritium (strain FD-334 SS-4) TaxID=945553 RepID=A0A0D2MTI5_HYPSF|nr:hypothetical protein HYPSUDRAFT_131237 [Hypholoma sublateritium FD-334 SS-4]
MALPYRPIITICGTTGVGKSKLAIDLAQHVVRNCRRFGWRGAKIINADSMQIYRGLDVLTNKIPEGERAGVPHLLMGFKQPGEQYVVGEWVQDTIKLINEMHENQELPIIVGGTSYWIQHLIFPSQLIHKDPSMSKISDGAVVSEMFKNAVHALSPDLLNLLQNLPREAPSAKIDPDKAFQMHQLLSALDPIISQRWHWKDTRKVLRSLEIAKETGRLPSTIVAEQSSVVAEGSKPRYSTLTFWLYAEPTILNERLDARVDDMISQGLISEVKKLREIASDQKCFDSSPSSPVDYTLGIYQSIGYKEFCGYLDALSETAFKEACERMKISTRQYAKRQISWIRNKLLPAVHAANTQDNIVPLYLLDATTLGDAWVQNVQKTAFDIQDAFLGRQELPDPNLLSMTASNLLKLVHKDVNPAFVLKARKRRVCTACTTQANRPVMIEEGSEWDIHLKTRSHRRLEAKNLHILHDGQTNMSNVSDTASS